MLTKRTQIKGGRILSQFPSLLRLLRFIVSPFILLHHDQLFFFALSCMYSTYTVCVGVTVKGQLVCGLSHVDMLCWSVHAPQKKKKQTKKKTSSPQVIYSLKSHKSESVLASENM